MKKKMVSLCLLGLVFMTMGCTYEDVDVYDLVDNPLEYYGQQIEFKSYVEYLGAMEYRIEDDTEFDFDPTYRIVIGDKEPILRDRDSRSTQAIQRDERDQYLEIYGIISYGYVNGTTQYYMDISGASPTDED